MAGMTATKEAVVKGSLAAMLAVAAAASLSAHIMVSPPESKAGATQRYELRVHNEEKVAIKSVELTVPDGIDIVSIDKAPAGAYTTAKTGDRITSLTWTVDVEPSKYLALPFMAKNPAKAGQVAWNTRAHMADGSVVEWSDKPGAAEKASVTKIAAAAAVAPAASSGAAAAGSGQAASGGKAPMSDADYVKAMKEIGPAFTALQRDNAAMNHSDGIKQAQLLSDRFKDVQAYWEAKKADDAVTAAKDAVAAADATIKASEVMDMTSLTSAQQKLQASCRTCHQAHREQLPGNTYKIK
jgi:uncharacterized protein YcnI